MTEVRQQFIRAVADDDFSLAHVALLIAGEEYPQLDPAPYLQRLEI